MFKIFFLENIILHYALHIKINKKPYFKWHVIFLKSFKFLIFMKYCNSPEDLELNNFGNTSVTYLNFCKKIILCLLYWYWKLCLILYYLKKVIQKYKICTFVYFQDIIPKSGTLDLCKIIKFCQNTFLI